jgi:ClpP class serine protease
MLSRTIKLLTFCFVFMKPMVCSFGSVAASGGYYVSAGAARTFALPTTLTGSIGVFGVRVDVSWYSNGLLL